MSLANLGVPLGSISASVVLLVMSKTFATLRLAGGNAALCRDSDSGTPGALQACRQPCRFIEQLKQTDKLAALPSFPVFWKLHHPRSVILLALVVAFVSMDNRICSRNLLHLVHALCRYSVGNDCRNHRR